MNVLLLLWVSRSSALAAAVFGDRLSCSLVHYNGALAVPRNSCHHIWGMRQGCRSPRDEHISLLLSDKWSFSPSYYRAHSESIWKKKKRFLLSLHIITVKWMSCFVENFHSNILSGSLKLCSAWEIMWRFHPHWRVIRCLYSDSTQEDLNITKVLLHYAGVEKTVFVFNVLSFW